VTAVESSSKDSIKTQLKLADKMGVKFVLILGQQEVLDKTVIIRDMQTGVQETIKQEKLIKELKKRLSKK
jgi:histidyl-tRNA synthetase